MPEKSLEPYQDVIEAYVNDELDRPISIETFAERVPIGRVLYYIDERISALDQESEEFARHELIARHDLGRMALHNTVASAAKKAEDLDSFTDLYKILTAPANVRGYESPQKARENRLSLVYPVAFQPIRNLEQRVVPVVAKYSKDHPQDVEETARLHIQRMRNLSSRHIVAGRLPYTRAYVDSSLKANFEDVQDAEPHWPFALALKDRLDTKKQTNNAVIEEAELEQVHEANMFVDLKNAEVRLACLEENLTRSRANKMGSQKLIQLINHLADQAQSKNAQAISKVLHQGMNNRAGSVDAKMLISIANGLLKPLSNNFPDLQQLKSSEPGDISQAIDRILYVARAGCSSSPDEQADIASASHAIRMYMMMGESFGKHKLTAADIHLRYPDTVPEQKAELIRCMYEIGDEFVLHRNYLQLSQPDRLPANFQQ